MLDVYIRSALKRSASSYSYSSTQIDLPSALADEVRRWGQLAIPSSWLIADGRETEPHVTVKYGLLTGDPQEVMKVVGQFGSVEVVLGRTFKFEQPDQDVLCIEVVGGPRLLQLNEVIGKAVRSLPNEDSHPRYIPHVTIAYVGKGLLPDHLLNNPAFEGVSFWSDSLHFSKRGTGEVSYLPLKALDLSAYRTGDDQWAAVLRELQSAGLTPHHHTKYDRRKRSFTRLLAYTDQGEAQRAADWLTQQGIQADRVLKAGDGKTWFYTVSASTDSYMPRGASPNNEVGRMFGKALIRTWFPGDDEGYEATVELGQQDYTFIVTGAGRRWRVNVQIDGIPQRDYKDATSEDDAMRVAEQWAQTISQTAYRNRALAKSFGLTPDDLELLRYLQENFLNRPAGDSALTEEFGPQVRGLLPRLEQLGYLRFTADEMAVVLTPAGRQVKSFVMGYTGESTLRELLVNPDWLAGSALWRTRQGIPIYEVEQGLGSILVFDGVRWYEYPQDETIYADVKSIKISPYAEPLPRALEDLARRNIAKVSIGGILTVRDHPQLEQLHPYWDYEGEEFTAVRKQVDQLDQVTFSRKKEFWKMLVDEVKRALVELKGGYLSLPMRQVYRQYIQHGRPWENVELEWKGKRIQQVESLGGIFRALLEDGRWSSIGPDDEIDVIAFA